MAQNKHLCNLRKTRPLLILVFAIFGPSVANTAKAQQDIRDNFLVDKIYDYNNYLAAEYFYDIEYKLIKKSVPEHFGYESSVWAGYTDEFEYRDGLVSKIIHTDVSYNMANYETHLFYNTQRRLITKEVYINGQLLSSKSDYYYEDGLLVGSYGYTWGPHFYRDTIKYDNSKNVIEHVYTSPELDWFGQPIFGTFTIGRAYFEYDNNPKPNFGLDYLFIYEPLPFNEEADLQRLLSKNNMVEFVGGSTWTHTYDDNGLPSTIEVKWKGIETLEPMLLRIAYKQKETAGILEVAPDILKINIFPNPAKDKFFVECENLSTITLFNMFGKEVLSQKNANGKSGINVSHLPNGIYYVRVISEDKVIRNGKIVKQ